MAVVSQADRDVFAPRSVEEASSLLAQLPPDQPVRVFGLGTNQEPRPTGAIRLETTQLAWVDLRSDDLTVAVGAGVRWSELARLLEGAGLRLVVDPVADGTVGAMVATSAHGLAVWRYGGIRDLLIGATLVLADGTIAHSGGHVIKNVAGYDLAKLACGARGRMALVAEVVLRAHPRARAMQGVRVELGPAELARLLELLLVERLDPVGLDWSGAERAALVVFEGSPRAVIAQAERLVGALERQGHRAHPLAEAELAEVARRWASFRDPVRGVVLRVAVRASRLLAWLQDRRVDPSRVVSYVGAGLADVVVAPEGLDHLLGVEAAAREAGARLEVRLAREVEEAFGVGRYDRFEHPLAARLQRALDPQRRFR